MAVIKAVVYVPTGEFTNAEGVPEFGYFEPQRPVLSTGPPTVYDPDYDVVVVPRIPDPETERWNGAAIEAKSAAAQQETARRNADVAALSAESLRVIDAIVVELKDAGLLGTTNDGLLKARIKARARHLYRHERGV